MFYSTDFKKNHPIKGFLVCTVKPIPIVRFKNRRSLVWPTWTSKRSSTWRKSTGNWRAPRSTASSTCSSSLQSPRRRLVRRRPATMTSASTWVPCAYFGSWSTWARLDRTRFLGQLGWDFRRKIWISAIKLYVDGVNDLTCAVSLNRTGTDSVNPVWN